LSRPCNKRKGGGCAIQVLEVGGKKTRKEKTTDDEEKKRWKGGKRPTPVPGIKRGGKKKGKPFLKGKKGLLTMLVGD